MRIFWALAALAVLMLVPHALAAEPSVTSALIIYPGGEDQVQLDAHRGMEFEVLVTVEDDLETRAVTAEFIHDETGASFIIDFAPVQNAKKVLSKDATKEVSEWRKAVKVDRQDLTTGLWDVVIRAFDNTQEHDVFPDVEAGEEMEPLNVAVANAIENTEMQVPGRITATEFDPVMTYNPEVLMRSGDRLRVNVSMGENLIHKVTYQLDFGGGLFTAETGLPAPYSIGKEILQEGPQHVVFRAYPRDLDRNVLVIHLPNVTFDTKAPAIGATQLPAAVFQDVAFDMSIPVTDASNYTLTLRFPGLSKGTQVRAGDLDASASLARLPGGLAYRDADNDRVFNPGDSLLWDTDSSLTVTNGDLILSGLGAGRVVDDAHRLRGAPLVQGGPLLVLYSDLDRDNKYSFGDALVLDDPAGTGIGVGKRSAMDVVFSGTQLGSLVGSIEAEVTLQNAPVDILAFDGTTFTGNESVYLTSDFIIDALDVRVANPILDLVVRSTGAAGSNLHTFSLYLFELGTISYEVEARDALGNRVLARRSLEVVEPITQVKVVDVVVHNATPMPGQRVDFTATLNQTDGVMDMPLFVNFDADDENYFDLVTLPQGTHLDVNHSRYPRPGQHTMNVSLEAFEGVDVLEGSVLWMELEFEVFLGAVEYNGQTFWVRANTRGLPGSAVLNPGDNEEVFDLRPQQKGTITVQAFDVDDEEVVWDPTERDADGNPVTRFEAPGPEEPPKDTPFAPLALVIVGLLAAAMRRR